MLLMFISGNILAQKELSVSYTDTFLKNVLQDIEQKQKIVFSYSEEVIGSKKISLNKEKVSILDLLEELSTQTGLLFEKISENQIIISKPSTKISICGYLFDANTKEPLAFATILVSGTTLGGTTNKLGYFELDNVEQETKIIIDYVGYTDKVVASAMYKKSENCNNIFLKPELQQLQEIVVLGYLTKGVDKNIDGSITLKVKDQGILPGLVDADVFEGIQMIPGVSSLDETATGIQIRGGSPDQNLIYFDDIKMYNTGHFFGMLSVINPNIVESTKLYKGGANPKYGDRVSGVIDISSDKNIPMKSSGGIGINGISTDAYGKLAIGKHTGLIFSGRRSYTDIFNTPTFKAMSSKVFQNTKVATNTASLPATDDNDDDVSEILADEDFFFYDTNAKLIVAPTKTDKITIGGMFSKNELDFFSKDDEDIIEDKLSLENQGASFVWKGRKFKKIEYSAKGYFSNFYSDYSNEIREESILEEESIRKNSVEEFGLDFSLKYKLTPNHTLEGGYQFTNTDVYFLLFKEEPGEDEETDLDDDDLPLSSNNRGFNVNRNNANKSNTAYFSYAYTPKNKALVSLGARFNHYSIVNRLCVEPRLNVEYPVSNTLRLKTTVEKRYQAISQLIEFDDTQLRLENNIWTLSNDNDIPILESLQFSGGFMINVNGWTMDIDAYYKNIQGLTSFTNGFNNPSTNLSKGESEVLGLDVLVKKKINNYNIWLGYTYNDINYTFKELQDSSFSGNNDIPHNFRVSNSLVVKNWELSMGWSCRSGAPYTSIASFNNETGSITYGDINNESLPVYHRLDASLLHKFNTAKKIKGTFGVSLQNLYQRKVPVSVYYRVDKNPNTGDNELNRLEQLSLGFMPNATFRLFF